jgi:hypothetical protein
MDSKDAQRRTKVFNPGTRPSCDFVNTSCDFVVKFVGHFLQSSARLIAGFTGTIVINHFYLCVLFPNHLV